MGKKFGIRKLSWKAGGPNSGKGRSKVAVTDEQERWQAFEHKLAQRMSSASKSESQAPTLLNNTGGPVRKAPREELEVANNNLVPPSNVSGRSERRSPPASPEPTSVSPHLPPISPRRAPASPRHATSSPRHAPSSPEPRQIAPEQPTATPVLPRIPSFRPKVFNRRRANSSDCESSFASGHVKVVPTRSDADSRASKASKATVKTGRNAKQTVVVTPSMKNFNRKAEVAMRPSDEVSTDSSSCGYWTEGEDSITYTTKETAYTYFTAGDDTVSGVERFVIQLASMFVCDFEGDGQACRNAAPVR